MARFPMWKGFEFDIQGCLLEQTIDLSSSMGVAYERCIDFYKDFHTHDRLMFVFPRGSCVMDIQTKNPSGNYHLDSKSFLILPKHLFHDDEGKSAIYDTLALYPTTELILNGAKSLKMKENEVEILNEKCLKLSKTSWLEHLLQQYFFERIIRKSPLKELSFFEQQIVSEILKILFKKTTKQPGIQDENGHPLIQRALKFIETNLFSNFTIDMIAESTFTSVSSLLREFKKHTQKTPFNYIRERRLEEAVQLLKKGTYSVGEVSVLVGYTHFGAFSEAFKKCYKKSPSHFLLKKFRTA